ncbi:UNVERIFIED_CONTAM: hypothetical protein K2H54_008433 [Gekko kuhli]
MKLRPITAFVHQPLIAATRASSEAIQPEPTTSGQPDGNLPERETAKQDVEQQADYEEAAVMLGQTENIELIQEALTGQGEAKEPQENNVNSQILQFTPALATEEFDDWQKPHLIQTHENSEKHRNAMLAYLTRK